MDELIYNEAYNEAHASYDKGRMCLEEKSMMKQLFT